MAIGISGLGITGTLSDGKERAGMALMQSEAQKFSDLVRESQRNVALGLSEKPLSDKPLSGVSSSQIARSHRLNGDYTRGFSEAFTSESDKAARPRGFAAGSRASNGKQPAIDKTSDLYAQSLELENYMVKIMMSSMRSTIQHTSLSEGNDYARKMYEDMMYDNMAESITKNAGLGLADRIYIELSGQA